MSYGDYDNISNILAFSGILFLNHCFLFILDALLADLQNSVPGHNARQQNYNTNHSYGGSSSKQVPQVVSFFFTV